jgi:ribokinase
MTADSDKTFNPGGSMSGPIVVVGSSNVDLIMKMARLPKRGETVTEAVFLQTFGGKGANQAVAAARAGGRVALVNCVGDDSYGTAILENLGAAQVDTEFVFRETGVASGTALILIGDDGDNVIAVAPGANYRLGREHANRARGRIAEAAMIVLQCEIPPDTLEYVVGLADEDRRPIMLNLAPARRLSDSCLQKLTYLILNESEAELLCGFAVDSRDRARQAGEAIRRLGPQAVLITLGAEGACICTADGSLHVPAFPVQPVDATAAGDTFCGSLAVALLEGKDWEHSVRFANAAAALAVTRLGAQPSIPQRAEIEQFLQTRPAQPGVSWQSA